MITSTWRLSPAVVALTLLFTGAGQAQIQPAPAIGNQVAPQTADEPLRREAEEKYQMRQIGDKTRIWVRNNLRNRIVEGKLTQIRPTGVVVDSIWIVRADIEENLQASLFQDKHDEMVAKYISAQLAIKKEKAETEAKRATIPPSRLVKTLDGKSYDKSKVMNRELDGLTFMTETGVTKVSFEQLPIEIQTAFGYDKEAADAYRDQIAEARAARAIRDAELNRIELAQKEEEDRIAQARWDEERKLEQARLEAARIERVAKADAARKAREAVANDDWPAGFSRIKGGGGSSNPFGGSSPNEAWRQAQAPTIQKQEDPAIRGMKNEIESLNNRINRGW